jgi:YD repeat-containing protein
MYSRLFALRSSLRIVVVLIVCAALLSIADLSLLVRSKAQQQDQRVGHGPAPRRGRPEGTLPDLDEVKNESRITREAPAPIPSTMRSPRVSLQPWNGRRVGDPEARIGSDQTIGQVRRTHARVRRAHALRRATPPPPLLDDQFVQNFFTWALARNPTTSETTYWYDQLRVAYGQGSESIKLAAIELGKTLFESAEYAARARDNHWYVYDLYKSYLMRDPDSGGWGYWEGLLGQSMSRENVRRGFEESTEFANLTATITLNGSATANATSLISARVDPRNQPANGMLTRDASWSVSLLSLPGRAGLDLGLALAYSSMVWTRSGPYLYFDEDNGFPSPGFRLGFPTVQRKVFDAQTARNAYLLITAAGKRVELRPTATLNIYDAADSSYLRLTDNGATLLVHSTDGTKLTFTEINGEYRCVEVKDRNGNYLTVNYNTLGRLTTITDTLGRVITFNYDGNANLLSITQAWTGQQSPHQWVSFGWGTRTMQSSFTNGALVGTTNNSVLPVVTQVALNDTSHFTFNYSNSLQVIEIKNYFGAIERNATTFTYETPAGDVPRLIDSRVSARNWTGINGVPAQVITTYSVAGDGACVLTAPDGTVYKEYYGTGWQRGLTTQSEVWSGNVRQKWTTTAWTQDNTSVGYETNPRVTETNVYDAGGNRRRTAIEYGQYAQYGLPFGVHEYAADGATEIKQTYIDYDLAQAYVDRRIIGLVSYVHVSNVAQWQSKISYNYDDPARLHGVPAAATQHDATYNLSLTARGNVTAVSRWDVNDSGNAAKKLTTYTDYYNTGTPVSTIDAAGHTSSITYADSFSDTFNRNTFAYPTTITDADGNNSYVQYWFETGVTTRTQSPAPAGQTQGAIQTMTYNNLGQLERITTTNNNAYKRFWYGPDYVASYATVNSVADELYSIDVVDGMGRVIGVAGNHPGSYGGYRLVVTVYDQMGRAWKQSNPTEINNSWVPIGDDSAGIYYTQQTYDWKGRPLVTTNPDGTTKEASYTGCGCAGGEVVTLTDEGTIDGTIAKRRQQKIYADVFGRTVKTEILNWQGGSVYSTVVNTYNVRDQVTQTRQYAGPEDSGTYQDTTMTYDGYGRLQSRHLPEQDAGKATTWAYNADDTVNTITDARGAITSFGYAGSNRHLLKTITHTLTGTPTITASFSYDAVGNRTAMTDGSGSESYSYNSLSQLTSESRTLTGVGSFSLNYAYNLAGELTSVTDPFGAQVGYSFDSAGRLSAVTGANFASVSTYASGLQYRAWGGLKSLNHGNSKTLSLTYDANLNVSTYEIPGLMKKSYEYYNDGRLKFTQDQLTTNSKFDRLYKHDYVGRITSALSGAEARGQGPTDDRPYNETMAYDPLGHLTLRAVRQWNRYDSTGTETYINNRRQYWQYDPDGRLLSGNGAYEYDAAGRISSFGDSDPYKTEQRLDGDRQRIKSTLKSYDPNANRWTTEKETYYIHSSVLGEVISEVSAQGAKERSFVFAGGKVMAIQDAVGGQFVMWQHYDASSATYRGSDSQGTWVGSAERDPMGADAGIFKPFSWPPPTGPGKLEPYYGVPELNSAFQGCVLDGIPVPCDVVTNDNSKQCPNNQCKRRTESFGAFADGYSGYMPADARYVGHGIALSNQAAGGSLDELAGVVSLEQNPQNPVKTIAVEDLRSNVEKLLRFKNANRKLSCGEAVQQLLDKAAEMFPKWKGQNSKSFMEAFDRIASQGNYVAELFPEMSHAGGTVDGDAFASLDPGHGAQPAKVYLHPFQYFHKPNNAMAQLHYAFTALHETFHLAARGGYTDEDMARVVFALTGKKGLPSDSTKDQMPWSNYWDDYLQQHCMPNYLSDIK